MKLKTYKKYVSGLLIALLLGLAQPGFAANYYADFASGNDSTGDGSTGNPYKTPDGAAAARVLTGGDEIRVAKTPITQLTGTCTFTNGSTDVGTSADQSAVVADDDILGKNSGVEAWWSIASVDADSITLDRAYWGASETSDCYFATPAEANYTNWNDQDDGTSVDSRIKITGGYDLTTEERTGLTVLQTTSMFGAVYSNDDFLEVSYFVGINKYTSSNYGGVNVDSPSKGCYFHHLYAVSSENGTDGSSFLLGGDNNVYEYLYCSSGSHCFNLTSLTNSKLSNIYGYGQTYTLTGGVIFFGTSTDAVFIENAYLYNAADNGIYINGNNNLYLKNITIDTAVNGVYSSEEETENIYFYNLTISNTTDTAFYLYGGTDFFVNTYNFSSIGGSDFLSYDAGKPSAVRAPTIYITNSGVSTQYSPDYTISSDTADARSGKCVKVTPKDAQSAAPVKVGTVKITSTTGDITLSAYIKKDGSFNGQVYMSAIQNGKWVVAPTIKAVTTSYVQYSIAAAEADLVENEYIDLYVSASGTAGSVFIDDFSSAQ